MEIESKEIAIPSLEDESELEEEIREPKASKGLTKKELIELLPEKVKESVGLDELKKLSKVQLEALVELEEMKSKSSDVE